jgi:hypothetical protein
VISIDTDIAQLLIEAGEASWYELLAWVAVQILQKIELRALKASTFLVTFYAVLCDKLTRLADFIAV